MFTTDTRLVVRTWDAWIAEITGITGAQALNRPLADVVPTIEQRGLVPVLMKRAGRKARSRCWRRRCIAICSPVRPSDRSSAFDHMQQHVTIGPLRDDGRITGIVVTIEDVTARVEHERELAGRLAEPGSRRRRHRRPGADTSPSRRSTH